MQPLTDYSNVEISLSRSPKISAFAVPDKGRRLDRTVRLNQGFRPVGISKKRGRPARQSSMRGAEADVAKAGDTNRLSSIAPAFHIIVLVSFCSSEELHLCNLSWLFSARHDQGLPGSSNPCLGFLAGLFSE